MENKNNNDSKISSTNELPGNDHGKTAQPEDLKGPIDMEDLLEIMDNDTELMKECFDEFIQTSNHLLDDIKNAIDEKNASNLDTAAHKFKGTLSYLSAGKGVDISARLELMGKEDRLEGAGEVYDALEKECKKITNFVNEFKG